MTRASGVLTAVLTTAVTTALLLAAALVPGGASAALVRMTVNPAGSFTTGTFPNFPATVLSGSLTAYHRFDETSGSAAADATGRNPAVYAGSAGTDYQLGVPGAMKGSQASSTAVRLNGANSSSGIYSTVSETAPTTFSLEVWFSTSTGGGPLVGFGSAQTGTSSGGKGRTIYLTGNGRLAFLCGGVVIASDPPPSRTYADGAWHLATATFSPTSGMRLYADGVLVAQNPAVATPATYTGYWRWGGGDDLGTLTPPVGAPYFTGSLDEGAVYSTELTARDVAVHYGANH